MAKYNNELPQLLAVPHEEAFDGTWPFEARWVHLEGPGQPLQRFEVHSLRLAALDGRQCRLTHTSASCHFGLAPTSLEVSVWGPYLWAMRPWALHCAQFPPSLRQSASPTGQGCGGCRRLEGH